MFDFGENSENGASRPSEDTSMETFMCDGVSITINGLDDVSEQEVRNYIRMVQEEHGKEKLSSVSIRDAGDGNVTVDYKYAPVKFERIRRITGYLVGSIDRWNNAKQAEERDRVKHTGKQSGFSR